LVSSAAQQPNSSEYCLADPQLSTASSAHHLARRGSDKRSLSDRRFPPPWSVEDIGAAFVVKDGQRL
jgi:hypothetical protein